MTILNRGQPVRRKLAALVGVQTFLQAAQDIRNDPARWGLSLVAQEGEPKQNYVRIYKIQ